MTERDSDWATYYAAMAQRPPRRTLLKALDAFGGKTGLALDLGCGEGRDTIELLRRGWRVIAIDAEAEAIERLRTRPDLPRDALLETRVERFEDSDFPACDLVNASFALPLVDPSRFQDLWAKIAEALVPGGRFSGQLFGERDSWRGEKAITFLRRDDVQRLLAGFAVELFEEEESDAATPYDKRKHWHLFHVVARKKPSPPSGRRGWRAQRAG